MTSFRNLMHSFNPFELHKIIVNEYLLKRPGDTKHLKRDNSKDKTDYHIIKEHNKFLWNDNDKPETWEEQFAKQYYEKLFKEYCIADLSRYKENKVALRWRIEKEVISGKGQFICGNKICDENKDLRSWEVNFVYQEKQARKNALVKIRLCPSCSKKLNYHSKKREVKRLLKHNKTNKNSEGMKVVELLDNGKELNSISQQLPSSSSAEKEKSNQLEDLTAESPWAIHKPDQIKSREEEMEEYIQDLLL